MDGRYLALGFGLFGLSINFYTLYQAYSISQQMPIKYMQKKQDFYIFKKKFHK